MMNSPPGVHCQALMTLTYWNNFELQGLGLPLTWVFLDLSIEQNGTFQTGKECKVCRAGF